MPAWKSSPCCIGVNGSTSAISMLPRQLIDLLLAQPGGGDIRGCQPAPTAPDMRADAGQGVKPQPAQPADLRVVQRGGRPHPIGVQVRAGGGVDGGGVELHGVH